VQHAFSLDFRFVVIEGEIEDSHAVNGFEGVIPFAFLRLLPNGEGGIKDGSLLEIILLGLLKFDDKFLAGFVFAIDVVDGLVSTPKIQTV
jgi:hypothetical protein